MKHFITLFVGLIFVAPFFILEWVTTSGFAHSGFPLVLFLFMWANSTLFIGVLLSVFKDLRDVGGKSKSLRILLKAIILIALSSAFLTIVADQMPCFLGGHGC